MYYKQYPMVTISFGNTSHFTLQYRSQKKTKTFHEAPRWPMLHGTE